MNDPPDDPATLAALIPDAPLETPITSPAPGGIGDAPLASSVGAKLATTMFLHHFAVGSWMVTLGSYVSANSGGNGSGIFAAGFIGIAYGAAPLGGMVSPFLTGLLADHMFASERIMAVLSLVCAAALFGAATAPTQWTFYAAVLLYFLCYYPSFSLATSMALHHLRRPAQEFPVVRACGTAGWVAGGLVVGWLWPFVAGASIEGTAVPMAIGAAAQLITAIFCLWLPHTPPINKAPSSTPRIPSREHLADLARSPLFRALMILSVLAHIPSQFYYVYSNVFFNWVGMPYAAAKMTLGQCVEVACMLLLPAVLLKLSVKTSILVGLAAWMSRFVWMAMAASPQAPARELLLYGAILLHGVAFTLVTISLQLEVDRCAGKHRRATAQGMFTVAVQGLGCLAGAQLAGAAGAHWLPVEIQNATVAGWQTFWLLPAVGAVALLGLTLVILPAKTQ